jgi:hypothetical protein
MHLAAAVADRSLAELVELMQAMVAEQEQQHQHLLQIVDAVAVELMAMLRTMLATARLAA